MGNGILIGLVSVCPLVTAPTSDGQRRGDGGAVTSNRWRRFRGQRELMVRIGEFARVQLPMAQA